MEDDTFVGSVKGALYGFGQSDCEGSDCHACPQTIALMATERTITELSLRKRAKPFAIFNCDASVHIFEKHLSLQHFQSFKIKTQDPSFETRKGHT